MSAIVHPIEPLTPKEYLEGERHSEARHEFVDGRVYAMAGASDDHNRIAGNSFSELRERLRGRPCEPFIRDMKVRIPPEFADIYYYPDVLIACDPTDNARYHRERPTVLFEVISPETERTDRREKLLAYRLIPSLVTYVLAEQDRVALTVLRRAEPGWRSEALEGPTAVLKLPEMGVKLPLSHLYERTPVAGARPAPT